jgi:hypothetical protein
MHYIEYQNISAILRSDYLIPIKILIGQKNTILHSMSISSNINIFFIR